MSTPERCVTVRKNGNGKAERFEECTVGKPWIPKLEQVELWESESFELAEWKERLFEQSGGVVRVLYQCSDLCGRLKDGTVLPVVFRKFSNIRDDVGVSKSGFFEPLNRAEDHGLCLRINAHGRGGRRKLLLLKRPGESPLHTVARAKGTAEKWEQEGSQRDIGWVIRALRQELKQRLAAETAEQATGREQSRTSFFVAPECNESLEQRHSKSGRQTSKVCSPDFGSINKEVKVSGGNRECGEQAAEAADNPSPPSETNISDIMDTEFESWLRQVLERFDENMDDQTLMEAARWIREVCGDSKEVRRALFAKALRLNADNYPGQKILSFIIEDAEEIADQTGSNRAEDVSGEMRRASSNGDVQEEDKEWEYADQEAVEGWEKVLEKMRAKVPEDSFEQHLSKLKGVRYGREIVVTAKDEFTRAWVHENYRDLIEEAVETVEGIGELKVTWDVELKEEEERPMV
jgi:hypothetical protein